MKIRLGFVSNSSSSSFCILGCICSQDEFSELEELIGSHRLSYAYGIEEYYDQVAIGLGPDDMKDEETLSQFKKRIRTLLDQAGLENQPIEWRIDGGYNG